MANNQLGDQSECFPLWLPPGCAPGAENITAVGLPGTASDAGGADFRRRVAPVCVMRCGASYTAGAHGDISNKPVRQFNYKSNEKT